MRKSKKQLLRTLMACGLVVSVAAGGTVAYLTDAETATNTFTVGKVKIDLEEPGYPGNDSNEVKNIIPNQEIVKDPQIENTGNNDALVFLRVEVPQEEFTELDADNNVGEKKLQDLFKLKNVSDQWELLRTETSTDADSKTKTTYVYAYKKALAKGSTTDKLFQKVQMKNSIEKDLSGNVEDIVITACAIQATDIPDMNLTPAEDGTLGKDVLDQVYTIFLNQSGDQTPRLDEGNKPQEDKTAVLMSGEEINAKMKKLAGNAQATFRDVDITITAIQRSDDAPSVTVTNDANSLISTDTSDTPVYAWYEDGIIKWWSEAENVNAENDLSYLCYAMMNLSDISGLTDWHTNSVTSMNYMFYGCCQLANLTPLANWNTSNVINMYYMFYECNQLTDLTSLASWQTGNVINMSGMFYKCNKLVNLTSLANWQIGSLTNMNSMFKECEKLTDASAIDDWNIAKVTDFMNTFTGCPSHPNFTKRPGTWNNGTFTPTT